MKFVLRVLITGGVIFAVSYLLPAFIRVRDFQSALMAALVLALVNAIIRPVVAILSLPITILTLGLFALVINALMLYVVAAIIGPGFEIQGFWQAIAAALIISVVSAWLAARLVD